MFLQTIVKAITEKHLLYSQAGFSGQLFHIFYLFFCIVVAIFDIVHDVEAIFHLL